MKKSLLFTIVMALLCLFGNVNAQTEAPGSFTCPADAWEWTRGGSDSRWDTKENWKKPSSSNDDYPGQTTTNEKVYIPLIGDNVAKNNKYPILDATIHIQSIFIESGAMLGNQFYLDATNWYTDVAVPTNRWILVSSPLRGTYSGDYYTATQGGSYTGPFAPSVYAATSGNEGPNRKFPYVIYERLFSNATQIRYAAYDIDQWDQNWANPTNALAYQFQPGEAVQILARGRGDAGETETFHFPASDTEYYYYNSNGQITQKNGADWAETGLSREQSGKPVYNSSSMTMSLTRNVPSGQTPSTLWAVGNPAFAEMSIQEFLSTNVRNGNTANYLYKHIPGDGSVSEAEGTDVVYWYDLNTNKLLEAQTVPGSTVTSTTNAPYITRDKGFKVAAGSGREQPNYPTALLGTYDMGLVPAEIDWNMQLRVLGIWWDATNGTNSNTQNNNSNITISKSSNRDKVLITNLAGISTLPVEGTVSETTNTTGTITIAGGTVVGTYDGWTGSNASSTNMEIYGSAYETINLNENEITVATNIRSNQNAANYRIHTYYAENVYRNRPLVFNYTINPDGSVDLEADKCFAIYPTNKTSYFYTGSVFHSQLLSSTYGIGNFFSSTWNAFNNYSGNKPAPETTEGGSTTSNATTSLDITFTPKMFTVSSGNSQSAPQRSASQGSSASSIIANYNNHSINTFIIRNDKTSNEYDVVEDAAILGEFDEAKFSLGTLAGTTRVAVNAINDTTRCQIVLTGVNGDVDLVFDNLDALGENVRLFDANDSTYTPLNGNHATATVTFGVNDSPLRYSLVWDYTPIIAGNETLTAIEFTAFSPAKGEVKVMSNELLKGVRIYNAAGQLITSNNANANEVSFSNLLSGIYVIEAYTANGKATKKVDVK